MVVSYTEPVFHKKEAAVAAAVSTVESPSQIAVIPEKVIVMGAGSVMVTDCVVVQPLASVTDTE